MANQSLRQSEIDSLQYIATMSNELVQMAEASRFPMISYLLGMAYAEAFDVLRGAQPARHAQLSGNPMHARPKDNQAQQRRA
ncbi:MULTISPECIES: hypothetical protein [unclassified Mesorhizobium]|uniref:hypothetical protein n=1 Tax=unclassified Mesorhizobium TaxID=325217 RepID=UPI000BAF3076|nr:MULTISPECIES: hypothetical protein [unclassified Mesorhizobium]PBC21816.1 hypothetical protein CK226_14145 [Mesorhizobium sp. WSM4311]TRD02417.1 hypothetical protein FJV82_17325 [Mesorhizobium sp. WSM4305]